MLRLNIGGEALTREAEEAFRVVAVEEPEATEATDRGIALSQGLAPQERVGRWPCGW
jgi:hypothetical protein